MEPLKKAYNKEFFNQFLKALKTVKPNMDETAFIKATFTKDWELYELKQRMRHIAKVLHQFLNADFKIAIEEIKQLIFALQQQGTSGNYTYMFIPDYVEVYGQEYIEESILSFETITPFASCEFAIRPFIVKNEKYVLAKLKEWCFHENHHIRRLASEGCRPRLPWAMALPKFKENPKPIIPLLTFLLNDESEYVRKSVANNLNDISKDHPDQLIAFTTEHIGQTTHTDWILKHANRNLLKQAEPDVMKLFGYGNTAQIDIQHFTLQQKQINLGDDLFFEFSLANNHSKELLIRLEYAIYYLKQNGTLSKKVFKISEKSYAPFSVTQANRKQHFKPISTRKYHFGIHKIAIIANGKEFDLSEFTLNQSSF